jgi:hypothetical protein
MQERRICPRTNTFAILAANLLKNNYTSATILIMLPALLVTSKPREYSLNPALSSKAVVFMSPTAASQLIPTHQNNCILISECNTPKSDLVRPETLGYTLLYKEK